MASLNANISTFFVLFVTIFLLSSAVMGLGEEHKLFKNINAYRTLFLDIPALTKNKKAICIAHKIVNTLEKPCNGTTHSEKVKLDNYPEPLRKCIGVNQTTDGVVLPVCIPVSDQKAAVPLLHNYTRTKYERYIRDSSFTGAGVRSNHYWMVVVMNKNTTIWSSAGPDRLVTKIGLGHCSASLFLGMLFYLLL